MKGKERRLNKDGGKLKRQLNALCALELDPFLIKDITETMTETSMK